MNYGPYHRRIRANLLNSIIGPYIPIVLLHRMTKMSIYA